MGPPHRSPLSVDPSGRDCQGSAGEVPGLVTEDRVRTQGAGSHRMILGGGRHIPPAVLTALLCQRG